MGIEMTPAEVSARGLDGLAKFAALIAVGQDGPVKRQPKPVKEYSSGDYIYIAYDNSRARLPECIASTAAELAWKMGVSLSNVRSRISEWEHGKTKDPKYVRIPV